MNQDVKFALITGFVGKTKDRFHEYNEEKSLAERLELVAQMKGRIQVNNEVKFALITGVVSKTKDRFHKYNEEKSLAERLEMVS